VNEAIPVDEAISRLTTSLGLRLDPGRHSPEVAGQLDPLLRRHKGNTEVYVQISTNPSQRVILRLDRERFVKPSKELKEELDQLLGGDCIQFSGAGTRRRKKQAQEALFKEEAAQEEAAVAPAPEAPPAEFESDSMEYVDS